MKNHQTKRLLALVLTLALTLSNVPATVFAEDVTPVEPQSTTEQQVQQEETTKQTEEKQQKQENKEAEFHGNEVKGSDLRGILRDAFGNALEYQLRPAGTEDEWIVVNLLKSHTLQSALYEVQTREFFESWKDVGTIQVKIYYNVDFVMEGNDAGGVQIDGQDVVQAKAYQNESLTFTVKSIDGYDVTVEGASKNGDGSYTIENVQGDTSVKVKYALKQFSTVQSVANENAQIKINGSSDASVQVQNQAQFQIEVVPNAGYAVTEIKVNDAVLDQVAFANQTASASYQAGENETYSVSATVVKTGFAYNEKNEDGQYAVGYREGMEKELAEANIFNAVINAGASVPAGVTVDDVTIQYHAGLAGWKEVDFKPAVSGITGHAFGKQETEKIKITYVGNDQYGSFSSDEITVKIEDPRTVSVLELKEGVALRYNTEEAMQQEIYEKVVASLRTGDGTEIPNTIEDFTFKFKRTLGEQTITVSYNGSDEYRACEATAVINIEKGKASVSVNSQNITYGESLAPVFSATPADAKVIGIIGGVTGNGALYVSVDASQITINDIAGKDIPVVGNISLQKFITDTLGIKEFKVSQLTDILQKIPGANISDLIAGIQQAIDVIEKVAPGLLETTVSLGGLPSEAGVYTAVGVTGSQNYKTALGIGLLTIAPKTANVKLAFDQKFEDKTHSLTIAEANAFDFGGHIADGDTQATKNVHTLYAGVTASGKLYVGATPSMEPGAYKETVYVLGGNYFALPICRLYTIQRENVEIKFDQSPLTARYDGNPHGLTAGVYNANGDRVAEAEIKYAGVEAGIEGYYSKEMPIDAGLYFASATFKGNDIYQPEMKLGGTVLILKSYAKGTIQVGSLTTTYGEPTDLTKVSYTTSGLAARDVETIKSTVKCDGDDTAAGSHTISVSVPKSVQKNYYRNVETENGTHTIAKRALTVQIGSYTKTYGTEDPVFSYEITEGSLAEGDTLNDLGIKLTRKEGENVGNYEISVANEAELNANYAITVVKGNLEITPSKATIVVTGGENRDGHYVKRYGDIDPIYSYRVDGLISYEVPEAEEFGKVRFVREEGEDANKTYTITPVVEEASGNYTYEVQTGELEILPRPITVSAEDVQKTYDGQPAKAPYTILGLTQPQEETAQFSLKVVATKTAAADGTELATPVESEGMPVDAGTYTVKYVLDDIVAQNPNYKVTGSAFNVEIKARELTVKIDSTAKVYGAADPAFTYTVEGEPVGEDKLDVKLIREPGEDVGTYKIYPENENVLNDNYKVTFEYGELTIAKKVINIAVTGGENNDGNYFKNYGDADPAYTYSVTDEQGNPVADDNLGDIKIVREDKEDVGTYVLTPVVENENGNYEYGIVKEKGTLTILPRPITISAKNVEKTYDGEPAEAPYKISGLTEEQETTDAEELGLKLKVKTTKTAASDGTKLETPVESEGMPIDAGTYTVTYALDESAEQNPNYSAAFLPFEVVIKQRALQIVVDGGEENDGKYVKRYDDVDPVYSYRVEIAKKEVTAGENLGDIRVEREAGEDVGIYKLNVVVENKNENYAYEIADNDSTLEILPRQITISAEDVEKTYDGKAIEAPYTISGLRADKDTADATELGLQLKVVTTQTALADGTELETPIESEGMPVNAGVYEVAYGLDDSVEQNQNYDVTFLSFHAVIKEQPVEEEKPSTPTTPDSNSQSHNQSNNQSNNQGAKPDSAVGTGDATAVMPTMTTTALAALAAIVLLLFKRRKRVK